MNKNLDEKIVWLICFFALFILITTEFLSLIKFIVPQGIYISWLILIITIIFLKNKIPDINLLHKINSIKLNKIYKLFLYFIIFIFITTFIVSVIYPPNTPDAMSYHMPRVMQWIQNKEISFFPTSDTRQLVYGPFSGYLVLHLFLLFGSDLAANLAQWFAMVLSVIVTFFIIQIYVKNFFSSLMGMVFCATIPMGIMQSTSATNDYMVSLWLLIMIFFLLKYKKKKNFYFIIGFGISLSFAILSKQTSYIFSLPLCFYLLLLVLKKKKDFFKLFTIPLIIIIINFGYFKRNYDTFKNPIGINQTSSTVVNENFNLRNLSSNFVRNTSLNLTLPSSQFNQSIRNLVYLYHDLFNTNIVSEETTLNNEYFIHFSLYETRVSNTLHFILIIYCIYLGLFNNRKLHIPVKGYLLSVIFSFIFFSLILKWQPWGNRLLLPFFVMFSPIVGIYFYQLKKPKLNLVIIIFLSFYSIPYLFMNETRPLALKVSNNNHQLNFKKPYFLENNRESLYFTYDLKLQNNLNTTKKLFKKINCNNVGMISRESSWEYPYWVMLRQYNDNVIVRHYDVKNLSKNLKKKNYPSPCFVIDFYPKNNNLENFIQLKNIKELDKIKIYY